MLFNNVSAPCCTSNIQFDKEDILKDNKIIIIKQCYKTLSIHTFRYEAALCGMITALFNFAFTMTKNSLLQYDHCCPPVADSTFRLLGFILTKLIV